MSQTRPLRGRRRDHMNAATLSREPRTGHSFDGTPVLSWVSAYLATNHGPFGHRHDLPRI